MKIIEVLEGTRCWKGYMRKGFKTMFGKRVPNCVKRENKFHVLDKFGQSVFESEDESLAINFIRKNYDDLNTCDLHESHHSGLRAWFGKGKKGGAGGGGWDRYNTKGERIGKCGDRKREKANPNAYPKPGRHHYVHQVARKQSRPLSTEREEKIKILKDVARQSMLPTRKRRKNNYS